MFPGESPQPIDEDEFIAAIEQYGYSPEFQAQAYRAVEEAKRLAEGWRAAAAYVWRKKR